MDVPQTKTSIRRTDNHEGILQAKVIILQKILSFVEENIGEGEICRRLGWLTSKGEPNYHMLYRFMNSKAVKRVLDLAEKRAVMLTGKAIKSIDRALTDKPDDKPSDEIGRGTLGLNFLVKTGALKGEKTQLSVPVQDLRVVLQGIVKDVMANKIEASYEIIEPAAPQEQPIEPEGDTPPTPSPQATPQ